METSFHISGIFPRSERLIQTTRDFAKGRCSQEEMKRAFEADYAGLMEMQKQLEFPVITDGMFLWDDIFRPFSENIEGVGLGGVTRYFENNIFFRRPVVKGKIRLESSFIKRYLFNSWIEGNFEKIINLPGPYTFSVFAEDRHYADKGKLLRDFSEILNTVSKELEGMGVKHIRYSEPALVHEKTRPKESQWENMVEVYEHMLDGINAKTHLNLFFGDVSQIKYLLSRLPFSVMGTDLTETSVKNLGFLGGTKALCIGCIDSRSSFIENPEIVAMQAKRAAEVTSAEKIYLAPSCDLEFLPYDIALKKISVIKEAAGMLAEK